MRYRYEKERENYEDLASGRVLYHRQGATSFPVRLASEVFLRGRQYLLQKGIPEPFSIYDPCCGGGYLLTVLGLRHGNTIAAIAASDIDTTLLKLAEKNLSLLTTEGLDCRIRELQTYIEEYDKESHRQALQSAHRLRDTVRKIREPIAIDCFQADAFHLPADRVQADFVFTDLPYGHITSWSGPQGPNLGLFLDSVSTVLKPQSILAVVTLKKQVIEHAELNRRKHVTIGKRRVSFLEPR